MSLVKTVLDSKSYPNELKVIALGSIRKCLKYQPNFDSIQANVQKNTVKDIPNLINLCQTTLGQEYFKIVAESFRVLGSIFVFVVKVFENID